MFDSVADSYKGKSVFITGSTGFLGKLFSRLRNERSQAFTKIIPIVGDISEINLGIKADVEKVLINNVSIVFHVAAAVKFNEPLEVAMNVNVFGTKRVLNLSRRMKNIKAFVYVSTAYSSPNEKNVEEVLYPAPALINEVQKKIEMGMTEEEIKKLLGNCPNTYTFTKALAENLIANNHGNISTIIIRPSIVTASKEEPVAGWINNWYGPTAFMTAVGKGLIHVLLASSSNKIDLIPVDYVTNLVIVAASKCNNICSKNVSIYNSSTSGENAITLREFIKLIVKDSYKHKFYDSSLLFVLFTQSKWLAFLLMSLLETVPAYVADKFLLIFGKQTRFMKLQARLVIVRELSEFVTANNWIIHASNTTALAKSLSPSDKNQFPFDPTNIKWDEYIPTYCQGIRQFLC